MSLPSKTELAHLFDEDSLATEAWVAEGILSWPSLRILERLAKQEATSTGELARELNMDMREIRDHLKALEESNVVIKDGDTWRLTISDIKFRITYQDEQLTLSHSVTSPNSLDDGLNQKEGGFTVPDASVTTPDSKDSNREVTNRGIFERLGYKLDQLLF